MKTSITKTPLPAYRKAFAVTTTSERRRQSLSYATKNLHKNVIKNPE
ncbi:hypothetical protein [Parapedobacter sp.]